jgi:2-polyprenyl-3-methyl-5-hydroxy-6-metoxy-1,4-benzoquinol methylase
MDYRQRLYERYISTHFGAGERHSLQTDNPLLRKYYRLNYLRHLPPEKSARILDIGCGMGQFLEFLRAAGYANCSGIDRSDEVVQYGLSRHLAVEKADALEHLSRHRDTYDAIVLNDVVEHFTKAEVLDVMAACYAALKPGGVVLIKAVNAANPLMGAHSLAIDMTHESLFSEESLAQLLNVCGFCQVRVLPLNIYANRSNPVHWLARCAAGMLNLLWRLLYTLYGRPGTRLFTKSILAVGRKQAMT